MASNVRVFQQGARPGDRHDTHQIAHARIHLKLAALSFGATRDGIDRDGLHPLAINVLCQAAIRYVEQLSGRQMPAYLEPRLNSADSKMLQLAALAYVGTRHGADAIQQFTLGGLSNLCQAAIRYAEILTGVETPGLTDKALLGE